MGLTPMWVKICANTNVEDASLAAELGADAVGFVFAPSKRQVTVEQVAAIVTQLPVDLEKVGVFATRDEDEIAAIVRATGLTGVQLHGGFDLELARGLRRELGEGVTIIQTLHWVVGASEGDAANNADEVAAQLRMIVNEPAADRVLVDSRFGGSSGGSGVSFRWSAARETLAVARIELIVAGGLGPENVAEAIATLAPWGVDVASGVEAEPRRKNPEKLRQFINRARGSNGLSSQP